MFSDGVDTKKSRERIISYLVENPGSSLNCISRDLDIAKATLRYHLDKLQRMGSIISKKDGNKDLFFTTEGTMVDSVKKKKVLSIQEDRVLRMIRNEPGIETKELFERTGSTKVKLKNTLSKLKDSGLVWEVESGGKRTFHPVTKEMVLREMMLDLVEMYLDGDIDPETYSRMRSKIEKQR